MEGQEGIEHWVEDLFPPTFSYTSRELAKQEPEDESKLDIFDDGQVVKKQPPSVYDLVARKISPLDVADIKNVYERVWLMTVIEEKERKRRAMKNKDSPTPQGQHSPTDIIRGHTFEPDVRNALGNLKLEEDETAQESKQVDIEDECLWNSNEIATLREVFKTAKAQNNHLKAVLKTNSEYNRKLERKVKRQSNFLEVRAQKLKEAQKSNERLQIAGDNFKRQLTAANKTIEFLHEEIKNLRESQSELAKEAHSLRLKLDKERIDRKNTQFDLISQQQAAFREMELREEKLRLLHEEDIEYLQNQVESLTKELQKEKTDHRRSLKGLQHLRNHFSSVPLVGDFAEHSKQANVVNADQLKEWTL